MCFNIVKMSTIVPGILTSDEEEYQKKLKMADNVAKIIQIDVLDGEFANNVTVGSNVISKYPTTNQLEIQLMVNSPIHWVEELAPLEFVSRVIFPYESKENVREIIYAIKKHHKQVGLSVNPETTVDDAREYFDDIDLFLVLAGNPGFSGQEMAPWAFEKIRQVKAIDPGMAVEVDIGVNFENARELAQAGADFLVTSSAIFGAPDFYVAYEKLAKLVTAK